MSMSSSSSSNLASVTANGPTQRDLALAANTLAIVQAQVSKIQRLLRGGACTMAQIADDINKLNSTQHGGFYLQKDLLCHAIARYWDWLAQHGWQRSTTEDKSPKCRGSQIGSFVEQPRKNQQVIPGTSQEVSIPEGSDLAQSLDFIAKLRDDILEASGQARVQSVDDLTGFFPFTQSVMEELDRMLELAGF